MKFDPDTIFYLSQDDKARVPLGLPVCKKQTAIVMNLDYKVVTYFHLCVLYLNIEYQLVYIIYMN